MEIAKVSMNSGAVFAHNTRAAAQNASARAQGGVARLMNLLEWFCARRLNVARTFGTEILRFCGRTSRDFARKFLKIGTMSATTARANHKKDTHDRSMHLAYEKQLLLSSAMAFSRKIFGRILTRDLVCFFCLSDESVNS